MELARSSGIGEWRPRRFARKRQRRPNGLRATRCKRRFHRGDGTGAELRDRGVEEEGGQKQSSESFILLEEKMRPWFRLAENFDGNVQAFFISEHLQFYFSSAV